MSGEWTVLRPVIACRWLRPLCHENRSRGDYYSVTCDCSQSVRESVITLDVHSAVQIVNWLVITGDAKVDRVYKTARQSVIAGGASA